MTAATIARPALLVVPAAAGAFAAFVVGTHPTPVGIAAVAAPVLVCALALWPWATLPVAIVGGALAAEVIGLESVPHVIAAHVALAGVGVLGVALRRAVDPAWGGRVATRADVPMAAFAVAVVVGAAYGLAAGNPTDRALVAAYELGVVPAYFFLATLTLSSPARLRAALVLFLVGAVAVTVAEIGEGGRHGGLFAALALPPTLAAAAAVASPLRRWLLLAAAAVFALDVVLSSYRALWLATGIALVLLLLAPSGTRLRRTVAAVLALAVVAGTAVVLYGGEGIRGRAELVGSVIHEPAGYRLAEAEIGWEAFLVNPLVGRGVGQVEPGVYVPDFGVTDVGPVYHAFYVMVLTNLGLLGLALLVWAFLRVFRGARLRSGQSLAFRSLLVGFACAAAFAAPTDGHWELGLLAALALVSGQFERKGRVA